VLVSALSLVAVGQFDLAGMNFEAHVNSDHIPRIHPHVAPPFSLSRPSTSLLHIIQILRSILHSFQGFSGVDRPPNATLALLTSRYVTLAFPVAYISIAHAAPSFHR
jgi:hypothetical protein